MTGTAERARRSTVVFLVFLATNAQALEGQPEQLPNIAEACAACPADRETCLGIRLYMAVVDGKPVQTAVWVTEQLENANRLFEPLSVGFQLESVRPLPAEEADCRDKDARDALGATRYEHGPIHVFVPLRAANVDEPGEIYGVHWRNRKNTNQRWIIVSSIAWNMTMVHEFGHFFGLSHSKRADSIMNLNGKKAIPFKDRVFTPAEQKKMRQQLKYKLRRKHLSALELEPGEGGLPEVKPE